MAKLTGKRQKNTAAAGESRHLRGARKWWLPAAVAVCAVIALVIDLPTHTTSSYRRGQFQAYLSGAASDLAQCQVGLRDAVSAYQGWISGAPGQTRSLAATYAEQAIAVCGFADEGIITLAGEQPPRQIASPEADQVAPQMASWAYLDAFTFLQDLRELIADPASASARESTEAELSALGAQRSRVEAVVLSTERAVGLPIRPVQLVLVSSLLPGGSLPSAKEASR